MVGVRYLRVSVTDRCDLRCRYCTPMRSVGAPRSDLLTYEEIVEVTRVLVDLGVRKVRLTGGEPLRRPGLGWLLGALARLDGVEDLGLTTNGTRLREFVPILAGAGYRVNVHLDSVDPARYRAVMGGRDVKVVMGAIREAVRAGIRVKVNAVCASDATLEDAARLVAFGREAGVTVRFIEAMPVSGLAPDEAARARMAEIEAGLRDGLGLVPAVAEGVARMYRGPGGERVGFITPSHARFCNGCDKVRLSSRGRLKTCLFGQTGTDLRPFLRGPDAAGLREAIASVLQRKQGREGDRIETMVGIGG